VHLFGFIIRIYHDEPERQISNIYGNMSLELIYLLYFISHVLRIFLYKELYVQLYCLILLHYKSGQACSVISVVTLML